MPSIRRNSLRRCARPTLRLLVSHHWRAAALLGALIGAACDDQAARSAPTAPIAPTPPALGVNNGGNNRRILFASTRDDDAATEIYSMNPDGSGVARLTISAGDDNDPSWSPDGKQVAFVSERHDEAGEIYVMNADGTGVRRLTYSESNVDRSPTWSKDGKQIAFVSSRDDEANEIYVMNAADGSDVRRITFVSGFDGEPAWSPDGKQLAFVSTRDAVESGVADVYVVTLDGLRITRLTSQGAFAGHPSWAPGGKQLAFGTEELVVSPDGTELLPSHDIYVLTLDGSQLTLISDGPGGFDDDDPTWSPDSKQIAFTRRAYGRAFDADVFVMNANGTGATRVTTSPKPDESPAWNR
jgi:Tol biopolymer transport system component